MAITSCSASGVYHAGCVAVDLVGAVITRGPSANLPKVTVPTLVVGANGDQDIFLSDVKAEFEASGAADKQMEFIEGADHFMRAGGTKANLGDPRPRLMKLLAEVDAGVASHASGAIAAFTGEMQRGGRSLTDRRSVTASGGHPSSVGRAADS